MRQLLLDRENAKGKAPGKRDKSLDQNSGTQYFKGDARNPPFDIKHKSFFTLAQERIQLNMVNRKRNASTEVRSEGTNNNPWQIVNGLTDGIDERPD